MSPDLGGIKRAESFRAALEARIGRSVEYAFVEKYRSAGVVSGGTLVGNVAGRIVIMIDDLIASGTTLARAAQACRDAGATAVYAAASHGAFAPNAASCWRRAVSRACWSPIRSMRRICAARHPGSKWSRP